MYIENVLNPYYNRNRYINTGAVIPNANVPNKSVILTEEPL